MQMSTRTQEIHVACKTGASTIEYIFVLAFNVTIVSESIEYRKKVQISVSEFAFFRKKNVCRTREAQQLCKFYLSFSILESTCLSAAFLLSLGCLKSQACSTH